MVRCSNLGWVACFLAGCDPQFPLVLPETSAAFTLVVVEDTRSGRALGLYGVVPEETTPDIRVEKEEVRVHVLAYSRSQAALQLSHGLIESQDGDGRRLPQPDSIQSRGLADDDRWTFIEALPASLDGLRLPSLDYSRCHSSGGCIAAHATYCEEQCAEPRALLPPESPEVARLPFDITEGSCDTNATVIRHFERTLCVPKFFCSEGELYDFATQACAPVLATCASENRTDLTGDPLVFVNTNEAFQAAFTMATPGTTIALGEGDYESADVVDIGPIRIVGLCPAKTKIFGLTSLRGSNVTYESLSVRGAFATFDGELAFDSVVIEGAGAPITLTGLRSTVSLERTTLTSTTSATLMDTCEVQLSNVAIAGRTGLATQASQVRAEGLTIDSTEHNVSLLSSTATISRSIHRGSQFLSEDSNVTLSDAVLVSSDQFIAAPTTLMAVSGSFLISKLLSISDRPHALRAEASVFTDWEDLTLKPYWRRLGPALYFRQ